MIPADQTVSMPRRQPYLQAAALLLGVLGLALVRHLALAATGCFALGGLCLALARKGGGELMDDVIPPVAPRQAWEPYFLLGLLALGLLTFSWRLGSIPEGANYSEGYLAVRSTVVASSTSYIPHDEAEVPWPTLYHYEGALAERFFGASVRTLRLPSVAWAMIVLAAVFFSLRVLTSPPTAAVGSLLWLAFHFNMHFARRYCPIIFLYLPPFTAFAAIILGLRSRQWWWWAVAGFSVGVALHGYLPGRVVPVVFAVLSLWLWLRRARFGVSVQQLAILWTVFFITGYPVLKYMVSKPAEYNQILHQDSNVAAANFKDPKTLMPYVRTFISEVQPYLLMFHVRGNSEYEEDDSYSHPVLDPVMGVLFPLGFFFCLCYFWRTVPFYLMVLFWIGLIPGVYSKKGLAPFPGREVIAFPAVFMMAALVLEELKEGLFKWMPTKRWLALWGLIGGLLLVLQWRHYWDYTHTPGFRRFTDATCYFAGNELREHREAHAVATGCILQGSPSRSVLMPSEIPIQELNRAEDHLFLGPGQDVIMLLSEHLECILPTLKELYPHADVKLYREPAYDDQAFLQQQMRDTIFGAFNPDITNPALLLARVLIPNADLDARQGWLDLKAAPGTVIKASDGALAQGRAGQSLHLGATVNIDTLGTTLNVRMPWPGWRLKFNGKPQAFGKNFYVPGDFGFVELEGTVPKGAQGPLPALVLTGPAAVRALTFAWRFDQGLKVEWMRGFKPDLNRKAEYSSTLLLPALRWGEDYKLVDYPAQVRITGTFTPPTSGEWRLRLHWPGNDGGTMSMQGMAPQPGALGGEGSEVHGVLQAGVPVPLRIDYPMNLSVATVTAFLLDSKGPGEDKFHWIDAHTLRPR